jgi:hypothetical protein
MKAAAPKPKVQTTTKEVAKAAAAKINREKTPKNAPAARSSSLTKTRIKLSTKFSKQLERVSDWRVAQEKAYAYLGKEHGTLFASPRKKKKYAVLSPDNRVVSFGAIDYEDFTKHKDTERRKNYLRRANNISGKWRETKFSPNNLAIHILW